MNSENIHDNRLQELLIDQATGGLDAHQEDELAALMNPAAETERDAYMRTAALVQLGMLSMDTDTDHAVNRMPDALRRKLLSSAMQGSHSVANEVGTHQETAAGATVVQLKRNAGVAQDGSVPGASKFGVRDLGWALAATFAVALVLLRVDMPVPQPAELRAQLAAEAGTVVVPWAQPEQPGYEAVSGDVVWSDDRQEGYMRLAGLPANDPAVAQYQLWIIDPERGAQPVDGGVFDMPAGATEAVVSINAKLAIDNPAAFAITLEQPGGVVVSAGPLLVVAAVES